MTNVEVVGGGNAITAGFIWLVEHKTKVLDIQWGGLFKEATSTSVLDDSSVVVLGFREFGDKYGVQLTTTPGVCRGIPGYTWTRTSITAHELGHVWGGWQNPGSDTYNKMTAIDWENLFYPSQVQRHYGCHTR